MADESIDEILLNPSESLSFEIKPWLIFTSNNAHLGELVKTLIALRNHNGGTLLIGYNDDGTPRNKNEPSNVRECYRQDSISLYVNRYACDPFEVILRFAKREDKLYPVLTVLAGVTKPVATKKELHTEDNYPIIKKHCIYVRTLQANNTPSTSEVRCKDWENIIDICFNNKQSDIGGFFERHMSELLDYLKDVVEKSKEEPAPKDTQTTRQKFSTKAINLLSEGKDRYSDRIKEYDNIHEHGSWEASFIIDGDLKHYEPDKTFLNIVKVASPRLTGWPPWLVLFNAEDKRKHPNIHNKRWESLIVSFDYFSHHLDFLMYGPKGEFYLYRALQDDISNHPDKPTPNTELDIVLSIIRPAEVIYSAISIAKTLGCAPELSHLYFSFRWSGLKNRKLSNWANPHFVNLGENIALQNSITVPIDIPLDAPNELIIDSIYRLTNKLYNLFSGFEIGGNAIRILTDKLLNRTFLR